MIKIRIKELHSYISANKEDLPLEHRLFLCTIVYGTLVCILGSILAAFLTTSKTMLIIGLLVFCIFCALYYFVRFKRIIKPFIVPIVILSFIGVYAIWVLGGGIDSSNIVIGFVALILASIIVPEKSKKYVIVLFLLLLFIVYLIQYYRPDLIIKFPSENKRWIHSILTITYSSFIIFLIIQFVHKNYTQERHKAEKSEIKLHQLNADKDLFISILGHDLRNPFNNLLGLSELLKENIHQYDIGEIEEIVNLINETSKNTYNLLEDILTWARAQQNKIPFKPQKLSFTDIY
ncbi:MAG: hypothetical protein JW866_06940, partial [Ignavibacteriales bacterium]|nr:hypothetical protein [Ignavibacteriales bacterium]